MRKQFMRMLKRNKYNVPQKLDSDLRRIEDGFEEQKPWNVGINFERGYMMSLRKRYDGRFKAQNAKPGIFNSDQGSQFAWVAQSNKKERPVKISPTSSNRKAFVSVGMDEGDAGITSSWSDSGEASSMRKSISSTTKACPRPPKDWVNISPSTTRKDLISH